MLTIRLQRLGKKKHPTYRFIVSENTKDTQAGSLELLGHMDLVANPKILELKADRIKHWLSQGATTSATVHNILVKEGITEGKVAKVVTISNKRKKKLDEKNKEKEEATKEPEAKKEDTPTAEQTTESEPEAKKTTAETAPKDAPGEESKSEEPKEEKPAE